MAFWNRKGPENLSISPEKQKPVEKKAETPKLSGAERATNFRQSTWKSLSNACKRGAEIGKKFIVGGFDRVAGKGIEGYDAAKKVAGSSAELMHKASEINVSEWATDKIVGGVDAMQAKSKAAGRKIKGGLETGAAIAFAAGSEISDRADMLVDGAMNWADNKIVNAEKWVDSKYKALEGWTNEQNNKIQTKAMEAKNSFKSGIESVRNWKNKAVEAYHQNQFEAHFAKLSPEAQAASMERLSKIKGGQELKGELASA
ncbi:MAG TPA: hypothetical protein VE973_01565 [Candidatus Limnocylindria bacterium]|nr:hypothetical protein [Candidatus Limnocylindria bacterium]